MIRTLSTLAVDIGVGAGALIAARREGKQSARLIAA